METIEALISIMTPGCFMASIDLKDVYYCVPIDKEQQKYLKFQRNGSLYKFSCYPNGLACCRRKSVNYTLRQAGHFSSGYIDHSYLQGTRYDQCLENVKDTVTLYNKLALLIHPDKSVLYPTQQIVFLGFQLNSVTMTISLTIENNHNIIFDSYFVQINMINDQMRN